MVDYVLVGWIAFLAVIVFLLRKSAEFQFGSIILKSKRLGKAVYEASKGWGRIIMPLADIGVAVGFFGMAFAVYFLAKTLASLIVSRGAAVAGVSVIFPGVHVPGSPVFLPFTYGIIAIATLAAVHELSHAVVSSVHGIRPKSIAAALFLCVIPGAAVEINEKKLAKYPLRTKLRIFAAGSFANFLLAALAFLLILGLTPIATPHVQFIGMKIVSVDPATNAGALPVGAVITSINGANVKDFDSFVAYAKTITPGERLKIETDQGERIIVAVTQPGNSTAGKIGITTQQKASVDGVGKVLIWFLGLFQWVLVLNVGVGIINLYPASILDGGRMIADLTDKIWPKNGKTITKCLFYVTVPLLVLNIIIPIVKSLLFK